MTVLLANIGFHLVTQAPVPLQCGVLDNFLKSLAQSCTKERAGDETDAVRDKNMKIRERRGIKQTV